VITGILAIDDSMMRRIIFTGFKDGSLGIMTSEADDNPEISMASIPTESDSRLPMGTSRH
jgi:hypothetical protein